VQKSNFKSKAKEREDLGVNLFNMQEEVNRSQKQLTSLNKKLLELEETRFSLEKKLKETQATYKAEAQKISANKEKGLQ
jgi:septal ring factor EnvC (AmiA/AmiB activator)